MSEFAQFREINGKLNKKFNLLRKPNLRESSESFRKLSSELKPFPEYAGYCMFSAAKCEHQIVQALKEQLQSSSSATGTTSPLTRTHIGLDRLLQASQLAEFQTWLETARIYKQGSEEDFNAVISSYAHAIQTCPSESLLAVVLAEFASLYKEHRRFQEASEIYIEGGFYREAADCLMTGQHFDEAYNCYKELFRQQSNFDYNYFDMGSSKATKKSDKPPPKSTISGNLNLMSFFTRKASKPKINQTEVQTNKTKRNIVFSSHLTIDDYITVFLLRLYLYDPAKYEYPSPIIPIPEEILNKRSEDEDECDPIESDERLSTEHCQFKHQQDSPITQCSLPFIDFINGKTIERSINDIIELNHLLETLYLSYRNELKHTIDNEYSDEDDKENDTEEKEDDKQMENLAEKIEEKLKVDCHQPMMKHQDSKESTTTDDEHHHSICHKSLDHDLDDVSYRLEKLANRFGANNLMNDDDDDDDEDIDPFERKINLNWRKYSRFILTNEDRLRKEIVCKLYPLLNHQQNQLLCVILNFKE